MVTKIALDPVWWLPGVAERFNISEEELRETLYSETGCIYSELVTRPDLKVFLPPIGSISVYIFGKVEDLSNEKVELSLRYFTYLEPMTSAMEVMCSAVISVLADLISPLPLRRPSRQPKEEVWALLSISEKKVNFIQFHFISKFIFNIFV